MSTLAFVRKIVVVLLALLLVACGPSETTGGEVAQSPNVLFILLDDLGLNDVGAFGGSTGLTPNIDRIAAAGVRFNRHYTDSTCTATRVGILTGLDPAALGFRPNGAGIPTEVETLPERLRELGYTTHHIGKWHAGSTALPAWPLAQGYDTFFGFLDQFLLRGPHPDGELREGRPTYRDPWLQEGNNHPLQYKGHLSEILSQRVLDFIKARKNDGRPWFLSYWTYGPHTPLEPMGDFALRHPDTPRGRYLALVEQTDALVGKVIEALDARNLAENTLVIIASDNGGTARQYPSNLPFSGTKAQFLEGGLRTPMMMRWPGHLPAGREVDGIVSYKDYIGTLVQLAGGDSSAKGRNDLLDTARGMPVVDRPLFWESSNYFLNSWSALDAGGNWRLTKSIDNSLFLFDLSEPGVERAVEVSEKPALVRQMRSDYRNWRTGLRKVDVVAEQAGKGLLLRGNDFQRSPGSEGWSMALALTPAAASAPEEVLAEQKEFWTLRRSGGKLHLSLLGMSLQAPEPAPGICTEIVISHSMTRASIAPSFRRGLLDMFYDGEPVASSRTKEPLALAPDVAYSNPTYLGQSAEQEQVFSGELGMPVVLNERLVSRDKASPDLRNGVQSIDGTLCPRSQ
ncbi:sulfatase family protein [Parahaliea aestuarii]|uniref:Sulfatase-like hydrolase/transferase n=1 Tax=Parahaliea aestuarii TaxID=1852021 RepID=A0A5C8ZP79_9GAMM|nr:sulfatase-like hydrolase/transferase [Parahaliea aestuarii]TXS90055.1 sulfatase-like hydrolase/transferase [Parahaliea aestuarii]